MRESYNCLIVDDEIELAMATKEYFEAFSVTAMVAKGSTDCILALENTDFDVILLDINLENESGFELCRQIRKRWNIPILFISARQSDDDVLVALNIGGDDYIKKPYSLSILLAKVKIIIRRKAEAEENMYTPDMENEIIKLDKSNLKAYVNGREVELKAKEFKLLSCLYENMNTIVTKEQLFDMVWGDSYFSDGTLNVHIRKLREKIEENPNEPKIIKTIWGTGYKMEI